MEPARMPCPVCGAPIPSDALHADLGVARCPACKAISDVSRGKQVGAANAPPARARPKVNLPAKFEWMDRGPQGFTVRWRWFAARHFFLVVAAVLFGLVDVSMLSEAMSSPTVERAWAPLAQLIMVVGIAYAALAGLVNRTTVEVTPGRLRIKKGPLPWTGSVDLPSRSVAQLYCTEKVTKYRDRYEIRLSGSNTVVTYRLHAIDRRGGKRILLDDLEQLDQALWLEQSIEKLLGIVDRPVHGEIPRWLAEPRATSSRTRRT